MPVTVKPTNNELQAWVRGSANNADDLLRYACPEEYVRSKRILQSSFSTLTKESHISPDQHGFVRAVWDAYSHHHHLTLRPEDVWFAILVQFSYYVKAHAEELRSLFVAHEDKKELEVMDVGTIDTADFGRMAIWMTDLIQKNVVDPDLREWIMPAFSTTTQSDRIVAAILMMGTLQEYFDFKMSLLCGIPTVTLLGQRSDWALLLSKIEKLRLYGAEPAHFATLLKPVLSAFVASFDTPNSPDVLKFWNKCVHHQSGGSGPQYLSGWITAFCFWSKDGRPIVNRSGCVLDGISFPRLDTNDIPPAFASVPVKVNDNGVEYDTVMVAGLVGIQASADGSSLDQKTNIEHEHHDSNQNESTPDAATESTKNLELNSIRPVSGWWMYQLGKKPSSAGREQIKGEKSRGNQPSTWKASSDWRAR